MHELFDDSAGRRESGDSTPAPACQVGTDWSSGKSTQAQPFPPPGLARVGDDLLLQSSSRHPDFAVTCSLSRKSALIGQMCPLTDVIPKFSRNSDLCVPQCLLTPLRSPPPLPYQTTR